MAQHDDRTAAKQRRREEQLQRAVNLDIDAHVAQALASREGRRFLWWLLQIGKVNMQPFTNNALTTAFACGELNVGQQVLARITQVHPAGYVQMQEENLNEYNQRVRDSAPAGNGDGFDAAIGAYDDAASFGPDSVD